MSDYADHPNWDEDDGWLLTLPPPKLGEACVRPHIVHGNKLLWSAHWMTSGIGGSGYYYSDLAKPLESVGRYINDTRRICPE